jgi:hypothetical protein
MAAKAHEISLEAGSKMAAAMKDVINAAAGLSGFVIESARDLVQYMVRRGQMTQEEADKLIREVEAALPKRKATPAAAHPPAKAAAPAAAKVAPALVTHRPAPVTHHAPHASRAYGGKTGGNKGTPEIEECAKEGRPQRNRRPRKLPRSLRPRKSRRQRSQLRKSPPRKRRSAGSTRCTAPRTPVPRAFRAPIR